MAQKAQSLHQLPLFLPVFREFQRSHVIGGLNVDASIGIGGKLGG